MYEIRQKKTEDPSEFLGHLMEAFKKWGGLDPDSPDNHCMLNALLVGQSYDDICRKLQKLEDWEAKSINTLVDLAFKVFLNRDKEEKRQELKNQSMMLAKVLQGQKTQSWRRGDNKQKRPPQRLGKDQCSFCFEIGH